MPFFLTQGVVQYTLTNQNNNVGVSFNHKKWSLFLDSLSSKYNSVIEKLTRRHAILLTETGTLLEEATIVLEDATKKQDNDFVTINTQLTISRVSEHM